MSKQGLICTRCHTETDSTADDFMDLSLSSVKALCAGWLCSDCLDEVEEIQATEAEERLKAKGSAS